MQDFGIARHHAFHGNKSFAIHAVHFVVGGQNFLRQLGIAGNESLEGLTHHGRSRGRHAGDIGGKLRHGQTIHVHDALHDVDGLVAHPLKISIDLDDRENEA